MRFLKLLQLKKVPSFAYCFLNKLPKYKFFSSVVLSVKPTKTIYEMKSAYFQCNDAKDTVHININYNENNLKGNLLFERPVHESLSNFLNRVELKLESSMTGKLKKKKKKSEVSDDKCEVEVCLLLNNELVCGEQKLEDLFQNNINGEYKLRINGNDYDVFLNSPMVVKMTLPKKLFVGTIVFPETLKTQYMDQEKSEFIWYKSKTPNKIKFWEECGKGFYYVIKEEDIDCHLRVVCTPKMGEKVGPIFEIISGSAICEFKGFEEINKRHQFTKEATGSDEFRILSYNILAEIYTQTKEAETELFTFCKPDFLEFTYRKALCAYELKGYNADIMCLQEVDRSYQSNLQIFFSQLNYASLNHLKEGTNEGCSFIYNKNKFNVLRVSQYIFSKELFNNPLLDDIKKQVQENEKLCARLQGISSQLQVVVLESLSNNILIIGNTHFYFHPDADHIRLLQGVLSWRFLQNVFEEIKKEQPNKKCSILLCGDLNSTPECGIHEFLNTGSLDSDHIGWKSKADEAIKNLTFQHSFKMKSAYDNTQYTNYTPLFQGCLDYIYYQTDHLKLKQNVPIPSEEVLSHFGGIPSKFFPSDHVALVADFKFNE